MNAAIYLTGVKGHWTARAYNDDTDEHIWSSEDASSITQALREVGEATEKYVQGPVGEAAPRA